MQVGRNLDAVVGPTAAGMVEASKEPAADSEMTQMGPESSEMMPNSPVLPRGSPTSVLTVWEPTESMVASLSRLQRAFRLRRRLMPVAVTFQRLWRGRQVRSGVIYGGVRARISAHLRALLKPHQTAGVRWAFEKLNTLGNCLIADEPGLGKTLQVRVRARAPARPRLPAS